MEAHCNCQVGAEGIWSFVVSLGKCKHVVALLCFVRSEEMAKVGQGRLDHYSELKVQFLYLELINRDSLFFSGG